MNMYIYIYSATHCATLVLFSQYVWGTSEELTGVWYRFGNIQAGLGWWSPMTVIDLFWRVENSKQPFFLTIEETYSNWWFANIEDIDVQCGAHWILEWQWFWKTWWSPWSIYSRIVGIGKLMKTILLEMFKNRAILLNHPLKE